MRVESFCSGRLLAPVSEHSDEDEAREMETFASPASGRLKSQARAPEPTISHSYRAIKLTNYFTNLLHHQQRLKQQQPKQRDTPKGELWRNQQVARQLPQQDIDLLRPSPATGAPARRDTLPAPTTPSACDEIKFIQSQHEMAAQFRASLYYLNPTSSRAPETAAASEARHSAAGGQQHTCFKCTRSIEFASTCVRVDNLAPRPAPGHSEAPNLGPASQGSAQAEEAVSAMEKRERRGAGAAATEEKATSADEGVGSSGQSSTAGSHCDDRDTPPHVAQHPHFSCDTRQLSPDSRDAVRGANGYSTDGDGGAAKSAKCKRSSSRKSRTLTWSASLNSLGASLKLAAGGKKSRSETNLSEARSQAAGAELAPEPSTKEPKLAAREAPIFFHLDCFTCQTCSELLVDLRALIYVNESAGQAERGSGRGASGAHQLEYVNIPAAGSTQAEDLKSPKKQLQLYCHRHFVELFKPRCQQCDCLILDEECTEAEGKVWHIKHFCCADCKVPLGGHQYIIVDQTLNESRRGHQLGRPASGGTGASSPAGRELKNQPYCLKCFDRTFGETCAHCKQLITCDSGAINHEQRSWHASAECFKCKHCRKSLLGRPFLPSADGQIYCSINCSELSSDTNGKPTGEANLSVAHYLDPRAMPSAVQHELEMNRTPATSECSDTNSATLMRHKSLIDYLIGSARADETSHQLLNYLQGQFKRSLELKRAGGSSRSDLREETKLIELIASTLDKLELERSRGDDNNNENKPPQSERRAKLNPFRIDSSGPSAWQQQQQLANYMNLDCFELAGSKAAAPSADSKSLGGAKLAACKVGGADQADGRNSRGLPPQVYLQNSKLSQCSPVASLISNEGTISDHSATSSGVSTAPPGQGSASGSLKSHSPLSSTSSHSSVSSHASFRTASAGAATTAGTTNVTAAAATNNQRTGNVPPQINSVAASLERRRRVQPITELSVVDLLASADEQLVRSSDGFEQLVSQFEAANKMRQAGPAAQAKSLAAGRQAPSASGKQQPDSFFLELAQRLPRANASSTELVTGTLQVATSSHPLDTNGLPTVEEPPQRERTVTDHYSTVNKAGKRPTASGSAQQVVGDGTPEAASERQMRDSFLALSARLRPEERQQQSLVRPISSLSVFAGPDQGHAQAGQRQQQAGSSSLATSYSTNSLNRDTSQLLLQPTTAPAAPAGVAPGPPQRPLTRPAKSVSFDPNVKEAAGSSSATLGRNSSLRPTLRQQTACWPQAQFASDQLAASSATMPASFAAQLKAANSLAAYSAHYDAFGRRVRLSTLLQQQALADCEPQLEQQHHHHHQTQGPASAPLLASGSRGGRREERSLRQQIQSAALPIQSQPTAVDLSAAAQFAGQLQPSTSGSGLEPSAAAHSRRQRSSRVPAGERRARTRASSSSRRSACPSARRRRRQRRHSARRLPPTKCSARHCRDCRVHSEPDDYSSQCSTCSSVSYQSDLSDCHADELASCSSSSGRSEDEYDSYDSRDSEAEEGFSASSYTSASESESELSGSSRSPSPSSSYSTDDSRASSPVTVATQRRRRAPISSACAKGAARTRRRRSSRSSDSTVNSRRRSAGRHGSRAERAASSSSRRTGRSSSRRHRRASHERGHATSRRPAAPSRRDDREQRARSRRSSGNPRRLQPHRREHSRARTSCQELAAAMSPPPTHPIDSIQLRHQPHLLIPQIYPTAGQMQATGQRAARSKSPSTMSTDSKSVKDENCRVI